MDKSQCCSKSGLRNGTFCEYLQTLVNIIKLFQDTMAFPDIVILKPICIVD